MSVFEGFVSSVLRVRRFVLRDVGVFEGCVSLFIEFVGFFSGMWVSWKGL